MPGQRTTGKPGGRKNHDHRPLGDPREDLLTGGKKGRVWELDKRLFFGYEVFHTEYLCLSSWPEPFMKAFLLHHLVLNIQEPWEVGVCICKWQMRQPRLREMKSPQAHSHTSINDQGNSPVVQWLRLLTLTAEGPDSILGRGNKIPQASQYGKNK